MLIPHLHFCGNCKEAISLYEKAFNTKVDYDPEKYAGDMQISHASMKIHGQTVFLNDNDMLVNKDNPHSFPVHLIVYFQTAEELLACYEILKDDNATIHPFVKTSYSALVGNFTDKFGMLWGFMVA
ncbi:MAG: VOC family protein [Oscillospiraceae bacterium]|nr:VOC family protein [Oscillospiraceae bacterium]